MALQKSHGGLIGKVRFFVLHTFDVGSTRRSLRSFDDDVIRELGEPRVQFAVDCSAVACPQLPRVPFTGSGLDEGLDREARRFFARPRNLRMDDSSWTIWLCEILRFYRKDFVPAHAPTSSGYVQRYPSTPLPADYRVEFMPYDWAIANSQRSR